MSDSVFASKGGMYNFKLPPWDVLIGADKSQKFDGVSAYAFAKRGQVLLAERWAKEYPSVKVVSAHPGWSHTPGLDDAFDTKTQYLQP